jgi:hypothetical protein
MAPKRGAPPKLERTQPRPIASSPTDNVVGKQLGCHECPSHTRPCYGIHKTGCITKQNRTASNRLADTEGERKCPSHRRYFLRVLQSCGQNGERLAKVEKVHHRAQMAVSTAAPSGIRRSPHGFSLGNCAFSKSRTAKPLRPSMITSEEPATPPPAMRTSATGFSSGVQSFCDWILDNRSFVGCRACLDGNGNRERHPSQQSQKGVTFLFCAGSCRPIQRCWDPPRCRPLRYVG